MVISCSAFACQNRQSKIKKQHFHTFPLTKPFLLKKWILALRRKDWKPTKYSYVCGKHFNDDDYKSSSGRYLKDDAVPSKFDFPVQLQKEDKTRRIITKYPLQRPTEHNAAQASQLWQTPTASNNSPLQILISPESIECNEKIVSDDGEQTVVGNVVPQATESSPNNTPPVQLKVCLSPNTCKNLLQRGFIRAKLTIPPESIECNEKNVPDDGEQTDVGDIVPLPTSPSELSIPAAGDSVLETLLRMPSKHVRQRPAPQSPLLPNTSTVQSPPLPNTSTVQSPPLPNTSTVQSPPLPIPMPSTSNCLSPTMSPTEAQLRRQVKLLQQKLSRRERKISTLQEILGMSKRIGMIKKNVNMLQEKFGELPFEIVSQAKNKSCHPKGRKYTAVT